MTGVKFLKSVAVGVTLSVGLAALVTPASAQAKKFKIYLSQSYTGNDWQNEATNMVKAMAKYYADKVDFQVQVSGPVAQKQIQQINAMVGAGANAIVLYPISPTALNAAIKHACAKGVVVFAYDSVVTEPCAYNVHPDQYQMAKDSAEWVAKKIGYKGNLLYVTGVAGTSVDNERDRGYREVVKKYPGLKIIGSVNGMWSSAITEKVISEFMVTHKWNDINGIIGSGGGWVAWQQESAAGEKLTPYGSDGTNGTRIAMLPKGSIPGAVAPYAPMGAPAISIDSPEMSGALALKLALKVLEGDKNVPKNTILPVPIVTSDNIKLCKTGSWKEMKAGCNVFSPKVMTSGQLAVIYSPLTPEVGLNAALHGIPEPKP